MLNSYMLTCCVLYVFSGFGRNVVRERYAVFGDDTLFVMMGSQVRVLQAAPFLYKPLLKSCVCLELHLAALQAKFQQLEPLHSWRLCCHSSNYTRPISIEREQVGD